MLSAKKILALVLSVAALSASAEGLKPEDMIKTRQAGYAFMAWNMGKIKANVDGRFDKNQVVSAANVIAAIANSGMGALYEPSTEKGKGFHDTAVKPAFFKSPEKVKEVAVAFNKEVNELAKIAAGGDVAAIKAQFGKVGQTCKGCHDEFRNKD